MRDIILFSVDSAAGAEPDQLVSTIARWHRGADGKVTAEHGKGRMYERWGRYSNGPGPSVPWDENPSRVRQRRPYRVWSDEAVLEEVFAAHEAAEQSAARKRTADNHIYRLREVMLRQAVAAWENHHLQLEHRRFVEDFATDDPALWEHHRHTIRLKPLPRVFMSAMESMPVSGPVTFRDLPGDTIAAALEEHPFMADVVMDPEPEPAAGQA